MENFVAMFERSVRAKWNEPALTDFERKTETYAELASKIASLHATWRKAGLKRGDKIAINAKSSSRWIEVFMAAATGGYVSVQLFEGFKPSDVQNLVNHSDAKFLYTEKKNFEGMSPEAMPNLAAAVDMESMEYLYGDADCVSDVQVTDVRYAIPDIDDLCAIMYTSGSTGNPKGVMLTVRNISWNVCEIPKLFPYHEGENCASVLPYAHIFGLLCDAVIPMCLGMHTIILGRPPIPSNVELIMKQYKPRLFLAVPLILGKFVEYTLGSELKTAECQSRIADSENNKEYCDSLRDKVMEALGGRIEAFATGGAAIPPEIEALLAFQIRMPFITGYGMTECAPLIAAGHIGSYKAKSCGEPAEGLAVRVDSKDPVNIPGEVQVKGDNVFAGYYKNIGATRAAFTDDGWFRTGDMGTMDAEGTLFLVGRCKNMLLKENGQNIFPEEIEVILNTLPYVAESLIVQRGNALHAIIVPDGNAAAADNIDKATLQSTMEGNIKRLNAEIPAYAAIDDFEIMNEPFAKTPKGSIRRFMYA